MKKSIEESIRANREGLELLKKIIAQQESMPKAIHRVRRITKEFDHCIECYDSQVAIVVLESNLQNWRAEVKRCPNSFFNEQNVAIAIHVKNLLKLVKERHLTPSYAVAKLAEIELKMDVYKMYDNPPAEKGSM